MSLALGAVLALAAGEAAAQAGWPSRPIRASRSFAPPGGSGTVKRIGRLGHPA